MRHIPVKRLPKSGKYQCTNCESTFVFEKGKFACPYCSNRVNDQLIAIDVRTSNEEFLMKTKADFHGG